MTLHQDDTPAETLPTWDITDAYESFDGRAFTDDMELFGADVTRLSAVFDRLDIRAGESHEVSAADGAAADEVISQLNEVLDRGRRLEAYTYAVLTTDSLNTTAQAVYSKLSTTNAGLRTLMARLADWSARLGADELAAVSPEAAEHIGPLRRLAERAEHQMSEAQEALYAELAVTGSSAWQRLHSDLTSQLTAEVHLPSGTVELPIAEIRGLATHADPATRKAAYEAEMRAWPTVALPAAAALNAIKGEAGTVNRHRRWQSPIDASLFANSVTRPTFEAMQAAIDAAIPELRRWMLSKARLHGHHGALPWWDLVAPLPSAPPTISWNEGMGIVRTAFGAYGGSLGGLVDRALDERWIDAGPRRGKVGGAYCMSFIDDRSLVLMNWSGSIDSAQTAAHELGHAYHNTQLAGRTKLQQMLPMALAETASIFCETLVVEQGLQTLSGPDRLALLDVDLQGALQLIVDIRSRFLFESEVYARRARATLSVDELNGLMLDAQRATYGDGLDQSTAHPYMWVVKPHYYGSAFYNWPYAFGFLFGLGLYARYGTAAEEFRAGYDDALSRCGMDQAEELAAGFGIDITDQAFWTASLDVVRDRIRQYNELAGRP